ncbi:2-oxoisovalerate dehydrogenase E2 component (dihydrolipoyl transacylase) [Sporothrix brasiliensis 5110]|uniref:Dihydrolipoamide acetyltransferase component of pyruvate dehydrogenase complex n=1 Tax=Sporothrix brasiliensis 5110 TaxID=1398154 RepID=A0A0C2INN3_9PEZI|nr:2-oxoisovalerate dehydrogenase E2 component (dihydrolipoyl transacylase) [Sporothrix brasiliensis 5110]KIH86627.1 2-oxoisovalerate dehydrogenase E2 component (dihydrolipoyl transacylase) [Sporothrix brasiliensis 5110]
MFLPRGCRGALRPASTRLVMVESGSSSRHLSTTPAAAATQLRRPTAAPSTASRPLISSRHFHASTRMQVVKPVVLADIGEGIVECEIIQWFVQPGARVEEFSPLCEVQSDKASVEITSRFAGVVKKLHYEAGEMAKVGKAFVDIDIPDEVGTSAAEETPAPAAAAPDAAAEAAETPVAETSQETQKAPAPVKQKFSGTSLATPAVRHLSKELNVDISQVAGTGKDGRVTKEDLHRYVAEQKSGGAAQGDAPPPAAIQPSGPSYGAATINAEDAPQQESTVPIGGTQLQMFKAMTQSLTIPHFLYADEIDFTQLYSLRQRVNASLARAAKVAASTGAEAPAVTKLSYMPFIIKAMSMALHQFPVLNARVEVPADNTSKPNLVYRSQHNIGVAMDTPNGLIVPVIRNVNARSVLSIASELSRLQGLAKIGKLAPADLKGGTITVSNIGNVGGTYLSPVIVEREVAIMGIGRVRTVPAFADDADDSSSQRVIKRHVCHFSFSADHRVVDGATMARAAEVVREMVERPDSMIVQLR